MKVTFTVQVEIEVGDEIITLADIKEVDEEINEETDYGTAIIHVATRKASNELYRLLGDRIASYEVFNVE